MDVSVEDVDRLWDWVRQDKDRGQAFFNRVILNSRDMHAFMQAVVELAGDKAMAKSIYYIEGTLTPVHVGFVMLLPILSAELTAMLHVYLRQDIRGKLGEVTADLIDDVAALVPGYRLAVWSPSEEWVRLHRRVLVPVGFVERTMFVRE